MSRKHPLVKPETVKAHRARWAVWGWNPLTGERDKMLHNSHMRGTWGWDVSCSCGWASHTGGATKGSVQDMLDRHRLDEQHKEETKGLVTVWDVKAHEPRMVTPLEAARGMLRYGRQILGAGSAACGAAEQRALELLAQFRAEAAAEHNLESQVS